MNRLQVDAHQHFWHYTDREFGWINDAMSLIRRDFLPANLKPLLAAAGMDATIAVQAVQSVEETRWLLQLARENDWIAGVVGWVPLASRDLLSILEPLAADAKLKGLRHVLQAEPDEYFRRADFNEGIAQLRRFSLVYDILVVERQLPEAIQLVDRHPHQVFVLDHVAKPRIAQAELEPWRTQMKELARRPNVSCKLSGMVTEADFNQWTVDDLRPYVETALEAFGPGRLLFGSDWPVCTVAASYGRWVKIAREFVSGLTTDEQAAIFGGNAQRIYRIQLSQS
jgi:L-fuconolactonase